MLKILIDILTPIFEGMGVSPTDVQTYVEMLGGYIYAIVGLFIAAIAVMVAAHWFVKKGTRHVVRWGAGISWVLIVTVLANVICFGPMYNNLAPILNTRATVTEESAQHSREIIEEVGAEGMALVKNKMTRFRWRRIPSSTYLAGRPRTRSTAEPVPAPRTALRRWIS